MDEELTKFVVAEIGSGVSEDDVVFEICQRTGLTWPEAENLVFSVMIYRSRQIARRRVLILSALGMTTIIAGVVVIGMFIYGFLGYLSNISGGDTLGSVHSIGILLGLIVEGQFAGELVFGSAMIAGGAIGLHRAIKSSI